MFRLWKESAPREKCPARDIVCNSCNRKGHWSVVCKSSIEGKPSFKQSAAETYLATINNVSDTNNATCDVLLQNKYVKALVDTGSSLSFINTNLAEELNLLVLPASGSVSMASPSHTAQILGECIVDFHIEDSYYCGVTFCVLNNLCKDVILGQDFMRRHRSIEFKFDGSNPTLKVCAFATMNVKPPSLFKNLSSNCKPIAIKSRCYKTADIKFIKSRS